VIVYDRTPSRSLFGWASVYPAHCSDMACVTSASVCDLCLTHFGWSGLASGQKGQGKYCKSATAHCDLLG